MKELKLTQILFQEAAQSIEGSLGKGIAAVNSDREITLFSTRRVMSQFQRMQKTVDGVGGGSGNDAWRNGRLAIKLAGDAVVGQVSYGNNGPDLCSVSASSGVNKFGPLAYQLVMYRIKPRWLRSDESLTTGEDGIGGSQSVWNNMYYLSKKGVYERRWLGSFFSEDDIIAIRKLRNAKGVNGFIDDSLDDYDPREDTSEKAFLDFLREKDMEPTDFGHFWAYQLQTPDPKIQELFDAGDRLKAEIAALKIRGMAPFDIQATLEEASSEFFGRRYHG